jgi:hypothetical protein
VNGVDPERKRWLKTLAAACEHALSSDTGERTDASYVALREDVADLLARIRAELRAADG